MRTSERSSVDLAAAAELREVMHGPVLLPSEPGYDDQRRVWNGTVDRRPAVIARCADVSDVQRALAFAVEHGLPVAVRGGGHSVAGFSTCDDGVLIDLGLMRAVAVDPQASQEASSTGRPRSTVSRPRSGW